MVRTTRWSVATAIIGCMGGCGGSGSDDDGRASAEGTSLGSVSLSAGTTMDGSGGGTASGSGVAPR